MVALGATTCPSKTLLGQFITIVNFGRAHQVRKTIRDAFQKKNSIWRDIVPTLYYPLPPFKSRDKNRRDIFWVLDPPPPLQK